MPTINPAQQQAITHTGTPLLIVAGAGTGKTTVITKKIAYLIENKLARPEEILALTFTEKAANEMVERVDELLPIGYSELFAGTFHSFAERLLEEHGMDIGLSNRFKVITPTQAWILVRQNLPAFKLNYYRPLGNPARHIHELIKHFTKCKDELITPEEYLRHAEQTAHDHGDMNVEESNRLTEIAQAFHTYNQLLLDNGFLDFSDLIFYTLRLLTTRPNILSHLQKKYRYILVDEFQDVNWSQYSLVKLLAHDGSNLVVVGDDDQSIYAFRGASVSNILRFKEDFPAAREIVLTNNYRSGQTILDAAYQLVSHNNPDRLEVKLNINKRLLSSVPWKNDSVIEVNQFPTAADEIAGVCDGIIAYRDMFPTATLSDIAILVRANNHAEPLVAELARRSIPYEFLASSGLYRQPIVLDALSFLKLTDNYHESAALYRLLSTPVFAIAPADVHAFINYAKKKNLSYFEALKQARFLKISPSTNEAFETLHTLIAAGMSAAKNSPPTQVLYQFMEASGYLAYLIKEEQSQNNSAIHAIRHIAEFFEILKAYETTISSEATVRGFLEQYRYALEAGDEGGSPALKENNSNRVTIMTIHSAKGLEFERVYVINMVEDRFPSRKRGEAIEIPLPLVKERLPEGDAHYQEERRLLYVALTRAKKYLCLTYALDYGGVRAKKPSRFLTETGLSITTILPSGGANKQTAAHTSFQKNAKASSNIGSYVLPEIFSFSQLRSYQTCPYQYKLGSVLKIPPPKGNPAFSFGQTMHHTLQQFYERIQELNGQSQVSLFDVPIKKNTEEGTIAPSLEDLLSLYERSWIPDWYESTEQSQSYFKKGKDILRSLYQSEGVEWKIPVILEGSFRLKIKNHTLIGRIDRIDQLPNGQLEIIDYKTGEPKEKLSADDKQQLLIYQLAVEQVPSLRALGNPAKLTFYYLNAGKKISFAGSPADIAELQVDILNIIEKICSGNFTATPSQFACRSCDYKEICEFRTV